MLVGSLTRENDLESMEIQGEVLLKCLDPKRLNLSVQMTPNQDIPLKPNPNIDRQMWAKDHTLKAKKGAFPLHQNVPALKYKIQKLSLDQLPFTFTYWFNESSI